MLHFRMFSRWLVRCSLLSVLVLLGGSQTSVVSSQQPAADSISLEYIPRDVVALFSARPGALSQQPLLVPLRDAFETSLDGKPAPGPKLEDISEFTALLLMHQGAPSPAFITRVKSPEAAKDLLATFGEPPQRVTIQGTVEVLAYDRWPSKWFSFQPDPLTIVFSSEESSLRRCIAAGKTGATTTNWAPRLQSATSRDAVAVANTSLLRATEFDLAQVFQGLTLDRRQQRSPTNPYRLAPLWQQSQHAVAELHVSDSIELRVVSESATADEAKAVHGALLTAISIVRLSLTNARSALAENAEQGLALLRAIDLADEVLEKAHVVQRETQVGLIVQAAGKMAERIVALAVPAVSAGRATAGRQQSMNNLKQLALAFHNYHDTYKTFPAATQIGPKDIPHSWRVTILPFLGQLELYKEYRQDEPWDSESNRRVLAKMPDVYRCPMDGAGSTNSSYFTYVGPGSVFENDARRSPAFRDIIDGTSNTLLMVESKEPIPWTKPEDLPFDVGLAPGRSDPTKPPRRPINWYPGGFCLAMCDGSVRFLTDRVDDRTLSYAIMRGDGNPLRFPE